MSYVALVATGGTVASTKSEYGATVGVSADGFDLFDDPQIEVKRFDALCEGSYRLGFANLATVHQKVSEIQADPDCRGVVVTHGTDTMEETAYFLDLTLPSEQPVVVTGAQRTFDTEDADGPRNIRDAVAVAASPHTRGLGTLVCFAGNIWAAQGVRKAHTIQVQAFNGLKVGEVNEGDVRLISRTPRGDHLTFDPAAIAEVEIPLVTHAIGVSASVLEAAVETDPSAIVLVGTGAGNAGAGFAEAIVRATESDIPVILGTRVNDGPVVPIYGNGGGVDLMNAGAISAGDLSVFQARILAAIIASKNTDVEEFRSQFSTARDRWL